MSDEAGGKVAFGCGAEPDIPCIETAFGCGAKPDTPCIAFSGLAYSNLFAQPNKEQTLVMRSKGEMKVVYN